MDKLLRKQKNRIWPHSPKADSDEESDSEDRSHTLGRTRTTTVGDVSLADRPILSGRKRASEPLLVLPAASTAKELSIDTAGESGRLSPLPRDASCSPLPRSRAKSPAPYDSAPLGLTLVYSYPQPVVDIIFVHGLGGTSKGTWSLGRDPQNFWPPWLGSESDLSKSRIFTFGYRAPIRGHYTTFDILAFAKDLIFRMKIFSGDGEEREARPIGTAPIIFVTHSMGGLIVKKVSHPLRPWIAPLRMQAYIIGKFNDQYADIVPSIKSMIFFATPHKGTDYANLLNNILKADPSSKAKVYVAELQKESPSLQEINEHFRGVCQDLHLVSFHETRETNFHGGIKLMIVHRDSALLEYPDEISNSLNADHHSIVKFSSPDDTNYRHVRDTLKMLMRKIQHRNVVSPTLPLVTQQLHSPPSELPRRLSDRGTNAQVMKILDIPDNLDDELAFLRDRRLSGSCEWILQRPGFTDWISHEHQDHNLLWLTGAPGSGKSTVASFIVTMLKDTPSRGNCLYHFLSAGNHFKRTVSYLLRSIAFQAALSNDEIFSGLLELHESTQITFAQQKPTFIWEKIFEGILFRLGSESKPPMYWVVDGIDESDTPGELIKFVARMKPAMRIKVLLVSRETKELLKTTNELLPTMKHQMIGLEDTLQDVEAYVRTSITKIVPTSTTQQEIIQEILSKACGSFLWVKLALEKIWTNGNTRDDIRAALRELPEGMEPLYTRMIDNIASQPSRPCAMATSILTWVSCSFRPLTIPELEVALRPDFSDFVDLQHTVEQVCGQFVVVNNSNVSLIHQTAREFLLRKTSGMSVHIQEAEGHKHAASVCMEFLEDAETPWRRIFMKLSTTQQQSRLPLQGPEVFQQHPFLFYALSFWSYHVSHAMSDSDEFEESVLLFLEECCLLWMNGVALSKNLRIMTRAAQQIKTYTRRRAQTISRRQDLSLTLDRAGELRQWANDIIRIVGRFGGYFLQDPSSVHRNLIPFCPNSSIISRSYGLISRSAISVTGTTSATWDDCLARLNMGEDQTGYKVFCKDTFFCTLVGIKGTLIVWHADTCEEARRVTHDEYVTHVASSNTSNMVATAGFKTTKVWDVITGEERYSMPKRLHHLTKALAFGEYDQDLLIAYDDCYVQCVELKTGQERWKFVAKEARSQDHSCARHMAFSPDLSQIAIVFRGRPVIIWTIQEVASEMISPRNYVLARPRLTSAGDRGVWDAPEMVLWQPLSDFLLVLMEDTTIAKWNLIQNDRTTYPHTGAKSMVFSPDGNLLLTSDVQGTLSIWMMPHFRLTYQFKYEELVMDLAFSVDGTRFYDIRGTFCNVWEPDALIRHEDIDDEDRSSAYETLTSEPTLSSDNSNRLSVTALAGDSHDKYYCCGRDDGTVTMYDIPAGEKMRKITSHASSVSVTRLAWSISGKYLISCDDSGRIIAKRLEPPSAAKDKWTVYPLFDLRIDESLEHLLFSSNDECCLIAGPTKALVMSLKSKKDAKELCKLRYPFRKEGYWMNHPSKPALLLKVTAGQEQRYLWKTFEPINRCSSEAVLAKHIQIDSDTHINRAVKIKGQWLLLELLAKTGHTYGAEKRNMDLLDLRKLDDPAMLEGSMLERQRVQGLARHVRYLIGSFQDRVVFMDHQFWLCTWELESSYTRHKRHYFLPKDWLAPVALRLTTVNGHGTLLVPRNGEVAIVSSGFR
ncbi:MAG: hypothetical protein M1828_003431 [Chrysothrix sp. TS-e1954]|nr:MAG: hypothetical protein M1828_003431 [Chrysothrix sp. TS-e1954]